MVGCLGDALEKFLTFKILFDGMSRWGIAAMTNTNSVWHRTGN